MPHSPSKSTVAKRRAAAIAAAPPKRVEKASAAEDARMEAKANRVRDYLAAERRREAELERQGYAF